MSLRDDLESEVKTIFRSVWSERDGQKVPEPEDLKLGNDAVKLEGTILYADLAESTSLVDNSSKQFAAEIYKTFLHCASKLIRNEGGVITSYDGDRVMGVFIGASKNTTAVRCALKVNYAVHEIINPAIKAQYSSTSYLVRHAVGVDASDLFIARTGVRGSNDLVWVGRSANYAAKLCSLRSIGYSSFITKSVYDNMHEQSKIGSNGQSMWTSHWWQEKSIYVYGSNWYWEPV